MYPDKRTAVALIITGVLCAAQSVLASESGSFSMITSWARDYTTMERPGKAVTIGTLNGTTTILESSGDPFVAGTHRLSSCLVYARKSDSEYHLEAHCTVTDTSNDKLYMGAGRSEGDTEAGGGGPGRWRFLGGTGKYAGVEGGCEYQVDYLENNWLINTAKQCEWRKP